SLVRLAVDGLLSFSATPLRLSSIFGFFTALAGIAYLLFAFISRVRTGDIPEGWTSTVALILIIGGVQLLMIGIVGEYLARVYSEAKHRPSYIIRDRFE